MSVPDTGGVFLVPAFTGLGAPYWDPEARGALLGLTRNSSIEHIVRAGLEAVCYQTRDLLECMKLDGVSQLETLRVDGGMAVNNWLLQFLADIFDLECRSVQKILKPARLGAIFLAGLQSGVFQSLEEISQLWHASATFKPKLAGIEREHLYGGMAKSSSKDCDSSLIYGHCFNFYYGKNKYEKRHYVVSNCKWSGFAWK